MPKNMNTNKAASAVYQNAKAIDDAKKNGGLFGAVTRSLGNRGFEIQLRLPQKGDNHGVVVQATPRKLFQGGRKAPVRISVGHVVLLEGDLRAKGDMRVQLPLEIVARLDSRDEIRELVKLGLMSSAILGIAETAGAVETAPVAQEDLFDSDEEEDFWTSGLKDVKGGLREQRKAAETVATISARVTTLKSQKEGKRKGLDGCVEMGDLTDATLFADPDYERFKRWRAHKVKALTMSAGGSVAVQPEASQTMADLMAQFRLEAEAARLALEDASIVAGAEATKRAMDAKAWIATQPIKENWDDEESVSLEDL